MSHLFSAWSIALVIAVSSQITTPSDPAVAIPVMHTGKYGTIPVEIRDEHPGLHSVVRVFNDTVSGSGTIVHYDPQSKLAYVQTCGHIWTGHYTAGTEIMTCKVMTYFGPDGRLDEPLVTDGRVLFYQNGYGRDCGLVSVPLDWCPGVTPIAEATPLLVDQWLVSTGCDRITPAARYEVYLVRSPDVEWVRRTADYHTICNGSRPGRSGGGLIRGGSLVGVCWGTSDFSGRGFSFFTTLTAVRQANQAHGFGWINDVSRTGPCDGDGRRTN